MKLKENWSELEMQNKPIIIRKLDITSLLLILLIIFLTIMELRRKGWI